MPKDNHQNLNEPDDSIGKLIFFNYGSQRTLLQKPLHRMPKSKNTESAMPYVPTVQERNEYKYPQN